MNIIKLIYQKYRLYGLKTFLFYSRDELIYRVYWNLIKSSYGQKQEDIYIDTLLNKEKGFYVDVGANDPNRFSNTKRFYLKGWCGINVEPNTRLCSELASARIRDINLNVGVGTKEDYLTFYEMFPDSLSTFSNQDHIEYKKQGFSLINTLEVPVVTLASILTQYQVQGIDLLTVDTEGFDLEVLRSNDWGRFKPTVVCIESNTAEVGQFSQHYAKKGDTNKKIKQLLEGVGYEEVLDNGLNSIYKIKS